MIVHGLQDENVHFVHTTQLVEALVHAGRPYALNVYPHERHGIRSMLAADHHETVLVSFLLNALM